MKSKVIIALLLFTVETFAQPGGSVELIHYFGPSKQYSMGPLVKFRNSKNWYVEGRYNYEALRTFSFYFGRAYSKETAFSYTIVPIVGGVIGQFKGGSAGLNVDLHYKRFFFSSQSQYTVSSLSEKEDFFFSWTEAGLEIRPWCFAGVAMQPTYYPLSKQNSAMSPGFIAGFSFGKWTIPFYVFDPFTSQAMLVCSIVRDFKINNKR